MDILKILARTIVLMTIGAIYVVGVLATGVRKLLEAVVEYLVGLDEILKKPWFEKNAEKNTEATKT